MKPALQMKKTGIINNRQFLNDNAYKATVDGYVPPVNNHYKVYHKVVDVPEIKITDILKEVSMKSRISIELLKGKARDREIVEARQFYFARCRDKTKSSLTRIGSLVNRDHATVLYGIRVVNNTLYKDYLRFFRESKSTEIPKEYASKLMIKIEKDEPVPVVLPKEKFFVPSKTVENFGGEIVLFTNGYSGYRLHSR